MASNTPAAAATLGAADGEDGTAARGARKRKTVDFFDPVANNESGKKVAGTPAAKEVLHSNHGTLPPVAITSCIEAQGMGIKLGDIPNVAHRLTKIPGSDEFLEQLHLVLYKRRGTASSRKKDTRAFSGWTFAGDSKEELGRIEERLGKWKLPDVHRAMDLVDLPRGSGDKAAKVRALVEFLEKPKQLSSRDVAATEAKKKGSKAAGKAEGSSAKKRAAVRKGPALLRQARKKAEAEEEEDEEDEEEEEEEEPEAIAPKPSKRKAPAAKPKAAAAKKAKTAKPDNGEEDLASLHAAAELLDDMLKARRLRPAAATFAHAAAVRRILSGVDVQNFNIAMLMAQLEKEFGVDVSARKPVIKAIALAYCQEQGEATAAAGEAGAAEADDRTANAASKAEPADAAAAAEDGSGAAAAEPAAPPAAVDAAAAAAEPAAPPAAADAAAAAADGGAAPRGGPADSAVPAGGPAEEPAKDPTLPSSGPPVPEGTAADPAQAAEPTAAPAAAAAAERAEALGGVAPGPAAEADAAPGSEAGPHAAA